MKRFDYDIYNLYKSRDCEKNDYDDDYDYDDCCGKYDRHRCRCCPTGPTGPTGSTGPVGVILGSYETLCDLIIAHPIGNQGDSYLVDGQIYVWDEESRRWKNVGSIIGPTGPTERITYAHSV